MLGKQLVIIALCSRIGIARTDDGGARRITSFHRVHWCGFGECSGRDGARQAGEPGPSPKAINRRCRRQ